MLILQHKQAFMQDINKYISGLLFIHDCVILPGFGGFVTNYHPAEHDENSHSFDPPKKDVLFNKNLTYNDGLLINYLAKNSGISYSEAKERIQDEVQRAWLQLDKNNEVSFDGVGTFKYDKHRILHFEPINTENFLTDAYGMSSFRFPPLHYHKNAREVVPIYNANQNMNQGLKRTLKIAAVVVPIIGLLTLIPYTRSMRQQQVAGYDFSDSVDKSIEETHTAMPADTNMEDVLDIVTDKRQALFYNEEPSTVIKKQATDGLTFYIIGASYKDAISANKHVALFKKEGFDATVLFSDDLYRVALCSFDSKVNALHELRRIRSEENNDKVWLYTQ
jgi:nucleoid DNA-binding protein